MIIIFSDRLYLNQMKIKVNPYSLSQRGFLFLCLQTLFQYFSVFQILQILIYRVALNFNICIISAHVFVSQYLLLTDPLHTPNLASASSQTLSNHTLSNQTLSNHTSLEINTDKLILGHLDWNLSQTWLKYLGKLSSFDISSIH